MEQDLNTSQHGRRKIKDRIFFYLVCVLAMIVMIPLFLILWTVIEKGIKHFGIDLFIKTAPSSMDAMLANISGEKLSGGILNGITGTLIMVTMAIIVAVPVGIFISIYLADNKNSKLSTMARFCADLLQGTPSIIIGVVGYEWIVKPLHGFSAVAGAATLAIMVLPLVVRSSEETIKLIPETLREAALSLGCSYRSSIFKVVLPSAFGGILTGILLGVARIMGETAPLILTALGASRVNFDILHPTSSISLMIWEFYNDPNLIGFIWSASLLLLILVFFMNFSASLVSRKYNING